MQTEIETLATAYETSAMYLLVVGVGLAGVAGILLALNIFDSAYRVYEFLMNRSPVSPGFGFSPLVIRIAGALLGVSLGIQYITIFN